MKISDWQESKLVRFGLVGALATVIDFAVFNLFLSFIAHIVIAASAGYFAGFITSYSLNGSWTFKKQKNWNNLGRFTLVNLASLVLTNVIIVGLVSLSATPNQGKAAAVVVVFFWNFLMNKYWVFTPNLPDRVVGINK